MRKKLKLLHRLIGAVGVLYMLVMAFSGTVLVYRAEILSAMLPSLAAPVVALEANEQGEILDTITAHYLPGQIRSIRFPVEGMNAYRVYLTGREALLLDTETLLPINDPLQMDRILLFLFDLHHYLALGDVGKQIVGILGIVAVLLVISGVYLWWPWKRGFRLSSLRVKGAGAAGYRGAHATMGILVAPLLLLISMTGSAMIYSGPVRAGLAAILGGDRPTTEVTVTDINSSVLLEISNRSLSGARVTAYRPEPLALRFKQPEEWLPNGRSSIVIENGRAQIFDATQAGLGLKVSGTIYPLHAGKVGGPIYQLVIAVAGVGTFFLALMAGKAYLRRRKPVSRRRLRIFSLARERT